MREVPLPDVWLVLDSPCSSLIEGITSKSLSASDSGSGSAVGFLSKRLTLAETGCVSTCTVELERDREGLSPTDAVQATVEVAIEGRLNAGEIVGRRLYGELLKGDIFAGVRSEIPVMLLGSSLVSPSRKTYDKH